MFVPSTPQDGNTIDFNAADKTRNKMAKPNDTYQIVREVARPDGAQSRNLDQMIGQIDPAVR